VAVQSLLDDITEELLASAAGSEVGTLQNAFELVENSLALAGIGEQPRHRDHLNVTLRIPLNVTLAKPKTRRNKGQVRLLHPLTD